MGPIKTDSAEDVQTRTHQRVKEPSLYKVLLHNDDYTTMEFVVQILVTVFNKSIAESTRIMLNVHQEGVGVCGVYTYELAETKVDTVERIARASGFPLKCSMERE